jgi:transcription initiation factor TFIIIB Brf1 subunit/transcription initiation factor TFIIB
MSTLSERRKDPVEIARAVGLPERVGNYAEMILERLENEDYQIPADARTYPAVVYAAARDEREPVTAGEVAEAAGVSETAVSREFRRVVEALDINPLPADEEAVYDMIEAFVQRFGRELDASNESVETARELLREGTEEGLFTNRTHAVAASLVLYASAQLTGDTLTQADFEAFGVSRTSIRKAYKQVLALRGADTDDSGKLTAANAEDELREAVEEIHAEVGFPGVVESDALDLASEVAGQAWTRGKSAEPIAAGVYWIAADENRMDLSQGDAAAAIGVHKVTVNRRVKAIRENTDR